MPADLKIVPSFIARVFRGRDFSILSPPGYNRMSRLKWLYAPTPEALAFALRTTFAALMALTIAMWMELDSPPWAAMTVWIVAQGSRGESLSKARWRLVGTALGATSAVVIVCSFPQAPWLFFPALSIWIGICCGCATLVRNFRSYALVLSGYTCAIIALAASQDPDNIFMITMSRTTYIVLGISCETLVAVLFAHNLATAAKKNMRQKIQTALSTSTEAVANLLAGDEQAFVRSRALFGTILSINDQIEFSEVEMGPHGHEGDHARAALAAVSVLLSRGLGMMARIKALGTVNPVFTETSLLTRTFLLGLPARLESDTQIPQVMSDLQDLRSVCRQRIIDALTEELAATEPHDTDTIERLLNCRILHNALDELLGEQEQAVAEFDASQHEIRGDHFHFRLQAHRDFKEALYNGIRAAVAIGASALIWELTAWPNGIGFITMVAVTCGLFATRENPVLGTMNFLRGACWAVFVSAFLVLLFVPRPAEFEMLAAVLALPMIAGGLAARNPATAGAAASYSLFLPALVGPGNQTRLNEIAYFNAAFALLCSIGFAVLIFRAVLPFDSDEERWRMRNRTLHDLRHLASANPLPQPRAWIGRNTDRFSRLIRHAGPTPSPTIEAYLQGTLSAMTIGLNIIRLRVVLERSKLPESANRAITLFLHRMAQFSGRYGRTARVARSATRVLRVLEGKETNITARVEITRAIAYLLVISYELDANAAFLDASQPYRSSEMIS
ncbi:FUSC family protein [Gluconacetobacter entanii]|uniref:FUSC family protein n=1 Tax=Gluconacetobacter entanii TaxID=108528 RepID=UPI001C931A34|nr:FUSC family protein [Gluconacetobacter entanii]MBY4639950.1 FUSC family protein [Gluconacetobacter entanii]MCW4581793.1 FUSC family protein [Gluconacetobacter entanii]MCW4585089.1 FUSC family protein [Gluconacetobacter entanii]MCW4588749.1 FUSC family protein [Gluconacetobacter entanii]